MTTAAVETIEPPVECVEGCGRWVTPFSHGSRAEIVAWADLKNPHSARRKGGGLNKVESWKATGRHRCEVCSNNLRATGHATQGRLL